MARHRLTETKVKAMTAPGVYSDGDGLYLRVRAGGSRQWIFVYRRAGKRTEIGLGGYGQGTAPVSLALAREKAEGIRERLARGVVASGKKTFLDVMEDVLKVKEASFRNDKHRAQWRMTLDAYAIALHRKPIADITRDDVVEALKPIWSTIPTTADRTRQRIAAVFDYARARGLYEGDNPAEWRGGLKELLPSPKIAKEHHEAVAYKDIPAVMRRLRESTATGARAAEFITLTAARTGEARNATWGEFDLDGALWVVPAARIKMKREHRVPLPPRAVDILKGQQQRATGTLVFEGEREGVPVSENALKKALRDITGGTETMHGMRSAFRDWAGDMSAYPREIIESALAHAISDKTEAAYRRSDALQKRRKLMEDWQQYCESGQ